MKIYEQPSNSFLSVCHFPTYSISSLVYIQFHFPHLFHCSFRQQFSYWRRVIIQHHVQSITQNSIAQITARRAIISAIRRECQELVTISCYHIQEYVNLLQSVKSSTDERRASVPVCQHVSLLQQGFPDFFFIMVWIIYPKCVVQLSNKKTVATDQYLSFIKIKG